MPSSCFWARQLFYSAASAVDSAALSSWVLFFRRKKLSNCGVLAASGAFSRRALIHSGSAVAFWSLLAAAVFCMIAIDTTLALSTTSYAYAIVICSWILISLHCESHYMTHYDVVGGWVMGLCKKPAWGRRFPPLAPPEYNGSIFTVIVYKSCLFLRISVWCSGYSPCCSPSTVRWTAPSYAEG